MTNQFRKKKFSEADIQWAIGELAKLGDLDKFPKDDSMLERLARLYLELVWDVPERRYEIDNNMEEIIPAVSRQEMSDKLIDEVLRTCPTRFPAMIDMRRSLERIGYSAADGLLADQIAS